jgi:hypothetical protein
MTGRARPELPGTNGSAGIRPGSLRKSLLADHGGRCWLPSGVTVGRQVVRERRSRALPKATTMRFTCEQRPGDGVPERESTLGEIPVRPMPG